MILPNRLSVGSAMEYYRDISLRQTIPSNVAMRLCCPIKQYKFVFSIKHINLVFTLIANRL